MPILRFITSILLLLLAACSTAGGHAISTGERYVAAGGKVDNYTLGVGDKVRLIVYNETSLSGEFEVNSAGALALPLIGDVAAQGKDIDSLSKSIHDKLANGYLRDPRVSVEVLTYRPFFILGEVQTPGQYPYVVGLTALNAVASAKGFTPRADKKAIFIRRSGSSEEELYRLTPDLRIWPGDTLRVGERLF